MKEFLNRIHKPGWKWNDFFLIPLLISFLMMFGGSVFGLLFLVLAQLVLQGTPIAEAAELYAPFSGVWIFTLLWLWFSKTDRPILKAIGTRPRNNRWGFLLLGIVIGFLMNGFCALCAMLNRDIALSFSSFHPGYLLILIVLILIQSSSEELVQRGFVYQRIRRGYRGFWFACVLNSLAFAFFHLSNPGVTPLSIINLVLVGMFYSVCVRYLDSLWLPMGIHTGWNFTQHILLGLPNSGNVSSYSVFVLDAGNARESFAYSPSFGVEGTLVATILHVVLLLAIVWWGEKKNAASYSPWLDQQIQG